MARKRPVQVQKSEEAQAIGQRVARSPTVPPSKEAIERRAYEIFIARGEDPGDALSDWLHAERELASGDYPNARGIPPV